MKEAKLKKQELKNHIAGALYGFAIGDSTGATTEFMTSGSIKHEYGEVTHQIGGGWLNLEPGEVTDDTQMMLCVMEALMQYPDDINKFQNECAMNFIEWKDSDPKDIGGTCSYGIRHYEVHGEVPPLDENKLSNGSLMRYLPCAILGLDDFNKAQGDITHHSEICASFIQKASKALKQSLKGKYPSYKVSGLETPSGKVTNTFNNAIYHASSGNFNHCLRESVNNGGDADTIAAIACSLAGARVGLSGIDSRLLGPVPIDIKKKFGEFIDFSLDCLFTKNKV